MQVRRIKKADSNFTQTLRRPLRRELDVDALSHPAALRTDAAVPVLGHANAAPAVTSAVAVDMLKVPLASPPAAGVGQATPQRVHRAEHHVQSAHTPRYRVGRRPAAALPPPGYRFETPNGLTLHAQGDGSRCIALRTSAITLTSLGASERFAAEHSPSPWRASAAIIFRPHCMVTWQRNVLRRMLPDQGATDELSRSGRASPRAAPDWQWPCPASNRHHLGEDVVHLRDGNGLRLPAETSKRCSPASTSSSPRTESPRSPSAESVPEIQTSR